MGKKFHRKIVKDRKDKEQYSINLPLEFVNTLQLEGSMSKLEIIGKSIVIKKIEESQINETPSDNNESNTDYETF